MTLITFKSIKDHFAGLYPFVEIYKSTKDRTAKRKMLKKDFRLRYDFKYNRTK